MEAPPGEAGPAPVRIDAARPGICADCNQPIAAHRLALEPGAARCTRCESERERLRANPSSARL